MIGNSNFMQRFLKPRVIAIIAVVLAVGAGGWWWHARNASQWFFRTAQVKRGDVVFSIGATGTLEPEEVVDVGAQVEGQINLFGKDKNGKSIDYGSIVEEGTVLAQIDNSVYAADVALAKAQVEQGKAGEVRATADLEQMKAKAVQAEADWNRAQKLGPSEALSPTAYDSYKANYDIARANVALDEAALLQAKATTVQAHATLDKAQRSLDFCTIKSPVTGVIIDRRVNIGQTVVASFNTPSLFLIAKDLTKMQIWVAVNEADVGRIVPGTPVTFTCDAFPGKEFKGFANKVRLNATMTQNVVMYTVEVNAENPQNILLPYLTANVHFLVRKDSDALVVPNAALRWEPSSASKVSPSARSGKPVEQRKGDNSNVAAKLLKPDKETKGAHGTIWLKEGEYVRPVEVKTGASDGVNTAVVADNLAEGQEVVIGEDAQSAQANTKNPFVPQIIRR
jgi:HlyD family secretion protein